MVAWLMVVGERKGDDRSAEGFETR
jgi:hypothetical protein